MQGVGLQVSISAESSSLTCHHLDIPNTTERNVVVWAAGQGGGRTGRSETAPALHTNHNTGQDSSNLLGLLQNTDRFNYFLNYSLAPGIIM